MLVKKAARAFHDSTYFGPGCKSVPFQLQLPVVGGSSIIGQDRDDLAAVDSLSHCKSVQTASNTLARHRRFHGLEAET